MMGTDYETCDSCNEVFALGDHEARCPQCYAVFCEDCMDAQFKKWGEDEDDELIECDQCTESVVHDHDVLAWLFKKVGMTHEQVVSEIEKEREIAGKTGKG